MLDPFRPDLLQGKTTLITGGGTGLGRSMALRLASLGAKVGAMGRRPDPLDETVKAIREAGGTAASVPADVRDPAAVKGAGAFSRLMLGPEMEKEALWRIPSRRFGEHWELTNLVAYLMSDASPYLTGDEVTIDGAEALFSGQEFAGLAHLDRAAAKQMLASLKPKK